MQITEEKVDALNLVLNVDIERNDYFEQYTNSLKSYAKKVSIPGFREGRVPMGIVKKKYGKALLADELNKLINEKVDAYIKENNIEVLGSPLPVTNEEENGNWDQPEDFNFKFDLGLAPAFNVELTKKIKKEYLNIKVDDQVVTEHIEEMRKRFGKLSSPEVSEVQDLLMVDLVELDDKDETVEEGIFTESTVTIESIKDKKAQKKLVGLKSGDQVIMDVRLLSKDEADLAQMLKIDAEKAESIKGNFRINVKEIKRMIPAEKDEAFFAKASGKEEIKTEEAFRKLIIDDTKKQFSRESDRLFFNTMYFYLMDKAAMDLPDDFLKRWIKASNENPISDEQLAEDYDNYAKSLKWQLIENKMVKEAGIKIGQEDIFEKGKQFVVGQYAQYGLPAPDEENLKAHVNQMLSDQKEAQKIIDLVLEERLISYLKESVKLNEKEVTYEEFVEATKALQS